MTTHTHDLNMETFNDAIDQNEIVIIDFWAAWCGPCKILSPAFEVLAEHNPDIFFGKVDTEACQDLAQAFLVKSVPTLMAFKKGELVFEQSGLPPTHVLESLPDQLRKLEVTPAEESLD